MDIIRKRHKYKSKASVSSCIYCGIVRDKRFIPAKYRWEDNTTHNYPPDICRQVTPPNE